MHKYASTPRSMQTAPLGTPNSSLRDVGTNSPSMFAGRELRTSLDPTTQQSLDARMCAASNLIGLSRVGAPESDTIHTNITSIKSTGGRG